MIKFKKVTVSLVQGTKESADCLFTDNEKLKEILLGNSNHVVIALNISVGIDEFIKWKGGVRNILENTGSRNVDVAINIHSPNAYVVGANDKLVSASLSVEYNMFNINGENYDNN
ncbi:MAG: hypothetical protein IJZ40_06125 [Bacteroidaceae bacterium]|nr:hypothetical protein [Bacteroidaceae bacterium]